MAASQIEQLLSLLNRLSFDRSTADALFEMAAAADPADAHVLRSIARHHRVKALELEAQLAALNEAEFGPSRA